MTDRRPLVLHVVKRVLERTQTFVQRRLDAQRFESRVLTWELVPDGLETPCPVHLASPTETSAIVHRWPRAATALRQYEIVRLLTKLRPDVVHAHFGPAGGRIALPCALLGIPLITSFYGFDAGGRAEGDRGRREMRRMRTARALVTAEGPTLAARLCSLGTPPESVRLLPLCLPDWALREPARTADPQDCELHLLQVARFIEKKGIDTTLRAIATARRRGVTVRLTLVGDGELRPQLEALAAQLELGDSIHWAGFQPYSELPRLLASSHAFIQPSRIAADGDTEGGHPTTLIEAMAQRVPVIATRHADIPLVVRDGETGLLAAEGDSDGVADAIETLHRSRERLLEMSAKARVFALRRHHPDVLLALRERIYREAIRSRRKS